MRRLSRPLIGPLLLSLVRPELGRGGAPLLLFGPSSIEAPINQAFTSDPFEVSGGVAPYDVEVIEGALPTGLALTMIDGVWVVSGTATVHETADVTLRATDAAGKTVDFDTLVSVVTASPYATTDFYDQVYTVESVTDTLDNLPAVHYGRTGSSFVLARDVDGDFVAIEAGALRRTSRGLFMGKASQNYVTSENFNIQTTTGWQFSGASDAGGTATFEVFDATALLETIPETRRLLEQGKISGKVLHIAQNGATGTSSFSAASGNVPVGLATMTLLCWGTSGANAVKQRTVSESGPTGFTLSAAPTLISQAWTLTTASRYRVQITGPGDLYALMMTAEAGRGVYPLPAGSSHGDDEFYIDLPYALGEGPPLHMEINLDLIPYVAGRVFVEAVNASDPTNERVSLIAGTDDRMKLEIVTGGTPYSDVATLPLEKNQILFNIGRVFSDLAQLVDHSTVRDAFPAAFPTGLNRIRLGPSMAYVGWLNIADNSSNPPAAAPGFYTVMDPDGWYSGSSYVYDRAYSLHCGGTRGGLGSVQNLSDAIQISSQQKQLRMLARDTDDYRRHDGDDNLPDSPNKRRTEFYFTPVPRETHARWGVRAMYYEEDIVPGRQFVLAQLHPGFGSPALSFRIVADDADDNTNNLIATFRTSENNTGNGETLALGTLTRNTPVNLFAELYQHDTLGELRIWRDGVLVYERVGTAEDPWGFGPPGSVEVLQRGGVYSAQGMGTGLPTTFAYVIYDVVNSIHLSASVTDEQKATFLTYTAATPWHAD